MLLDIGSHFLVFSIAPRIVTSKFLLLNFDLVLEIAIIIGLKL